MAVMVALIKINGNFEADYLRVTLIENVQSFHFFYKRDI